MKGPASLVLLNHMPALINGSVNPAMCIAETPAEMIVYVVTACKSVSTKKALLNPRLLVQLLIWYSLRKKKQASDVQANLGKLRAVMKAFGNIAIMKA